MGDVSGQCELTSPQHACDITSAVRLKSKSQEGDQMDESGLLSHDERQVRRRQSAVEYHEGDFSHPCHSLMKFAAGPDTRPSDLLLPLNIKGSELQSHRISYCELTDCSSLTLYLGECW